MREIRNKQRIIAACLVFVLQSTACSQGEAWSFLSFNEQRCGKQEIIFDVARELKADIYYTAWEGQCASASETQADTVIFLYGGSWKEGDKKTYGFVADAFVEAGYNVLIPNYRLFPKVAYPSFIEDFERFTLWLNENASTYNINLENVVLIGHSAGAYNATMYLSDQRYAKPFFIKGFVGLAGPYDFFLPTEDPEYVQIFTRNNPSFNSSSQLPVNQDSADLAEVLGSALLLHGEADTIVTPKNIEVMRAFLASKGVPVSSKLYPEMGHIALVAKVNNVPFTDSEIKADVLRYVKRTLAQ